uniref:Uncharacterized protein n=1 Tax=Anguilla anguilla TaxID=7936 RepID=A0A0E9PY23_ANGAN
MLISSIPVNQQQMQTQSFVAMSMYCITLSINALPTPLNQKTIFRRKKKSKFATPCEHVALYVALKSCPYSACYL